GVIALLFSLDNWWEVRSLQRRVGCELDSCIMGRRRRARIQRGCAGFQLDRAAAVRVARFVCSDSSAASASGGTSGSNASTLSCCSEDPAGCAATRLGSYGANGLLPTEYGLGPVTEERGAFVPQKP